MRTAIAILALLAVPPFAALAQPAPVPAPSAEAQPVPAPEAQPAPAPETQPVPAPEARPALAPEAPAPTPAPRKDRGAFLVGAKAGGVVPFNALGAAVAGTIEAGWLLPQRERSFALVLEVSYAQPTASGSADDPRVGGARYDWKLEQRELVLAPTVHYRLVGFAGLVGVPRLARLVPYAGIGPRVYLLESVVSGSAGGQGMPSTTERSTKLGVGLPLGAEYALGPGRLTGELLFEWGALGHRATGSGTSTAGMTLRAGYRLVF